MTSMDGMAEEGDMRDVTIIFYWKAPNMNKNQTKKKNEMQIIKQI